MQNENIKSIVATNLWDMLVEVQSAVKQGYVISDKNEYFPQAYVGMYTCGMILVNQNDTGMVKDVSKEETNVAIQDALSKVPTEPSAARTEQEVAQGISSEDKAAVEPAKQVTKRGRK